MVGGGGWRGVRRCGCPRGRGICALLICDGLSRRRAGLSGRLWGGVTGRMDGHLVAGEASGCDTGLRVGRGWGVAGQRSGCWAEGLGQRGGGCRRGGVVD